MRLQLIAVTALALSAPAAAAPPAPAPEKPAGVTASTRVNHYSDNDGNAIVTPVTEVRAQVTPAVEVSAHAAFDVMTCASVDVISAASPDGYFQETRQEYGASTTVALGTLTLALGGLLSLENDFSSFTTSLGVSSELARRNTTLSAGYAFTDSNVGRAGDARFERDIDSHVVTLGVTQVLSPHLVAQLNYFFGALDGFQSSPYRTVQIADGTRTEERAPSERMRHAAVARLKAAIGARSYVAGDYRLYLDTWGIASHTFEAAIEHEVTPWLALRLRDRVYLQSAADFYRGTYDQRRAFMTADRELGALWSNLVGLKATITRALGRTTTLIVDAKVDFMLQRFDDFEPLPERRMWIIELGIRLTL